MTKTLIIDDRRTFIDGREAVVITSSLSAIEHFTDENGNYNGISYDEVWLDFSLVGSDDILPFIRFAARQAGDGTPLNVKRFVVHTSSWDGAGLISHVLDRYYTTVRFDIQADGTKLSR